MSDADIETRYWANHAARGGSLNPLGKPCWDCAVVCGMYAEMTDSLAQQPQAIIDAVSANWFCHNHPNRACRGNIDRLAAHQQQIED